MLYSKIFDDVYFSREDGWAETAHVFLNGNNLPDAWKNKDRFTIAETGFGTGLNFFMAADLFTRTHQDKQSLEFISFEKYPLSYDEIHAALTLWHPALLNHIQLIENQYALNAGEHIITLNGHITLRLYIGDVNEHLPSVKTSVDCWFLDGFKPASNPDMWSDTVFENMARLSKPGTTFATFTAAGFVRRGLQAAGFHVTKASGFGRKRDMLTGYWP